MRCEAGCAGNSLIEWMIYIDQLINQDGHISSAQGAKRKVKYVSHASVDEEEEKKRADRVLTPGG